MDLLLDNAKPTLLEGLGDLLDDSSNIVHQDWVVLCGCIEVHLEVLHYEIEISSGIKANKEVYSWIFSRKLLLVDAGAIPMYILII